MSKETRINYSYQDLDLGALEQNKIGLSCSNQRSNTCACRSRYRLFYVIWVGCHSRVSDRI